MLGRKQAGTAQLFHLPAQQYDIIGKASSMAFKWSLMSLSAVPAKNLYLYLYIYIYICTHKKILVGVSA